MISQDNKVFRSTGDLKRDLDVIPAFNSEILDDICKAALDVKVQAPPYDYI